MGTIRIANEDGKSNVTTALEDATNTSRLVRCPSATIRSRIAGTSSRPSSKVRGRRTPQLPSHVTPVETSQPNIDNDSMFQVDAPPRLPPRFPKPPLASDQTKSPPSRDFPVPKLEMAVLNPPSWWQKISSRTVTLPLNAHSLPLDRACEKRPMATNHSPIGRSEKLSKR